MKILLRHHTVYLALAMLMCIAACEDGKESNESINRRMLMAGKPWILQAVTVDGSDKLEIYDGLKLTFSENTYQATDGGGVWPQSDTWNFNDESAKSFLRGDGVEVAIQELTDNSLILSMMWDDTILGPGREKGIQGPHIFTFTR